ncbi:OpgC family protein [Roseobacter sp. HKCCA0434]|uniref:OpgC family protein n=1 Tax=Roseobacter sp. HKCCA0434 TaxID=3079297 RepID=UPI0029058EF3|nr:OpgC domain-containing protein [Roseobacter sp. HKCCA0434]
MNTPSTTAPPPSAPGARKPRDPRLDFFRGMAMFIILLAHTPGNTWTLWIPARFGFSDGADLFVFCSGMASALAFGGIFGKAGWALGAMRIAHRIWQVYWAHIGIFLVTALLLFSIDHFGIGNWDRPYIERPYVVPLFNETGESLLGLMTLSYVPGLFDILPMYIVILAMIPVVMAIHRAAGTAAVLVVLGFLWLAANLAGWAYRIEDPTGLNAFQTTLHGIGQRFGFLNLPSNPFGEGRWFFNPFGWQITFFAGFVLGMKWVPAPPRARWLFRLAVAYVLLVVPFAWFKIHGGLYLPGDWAIQDVIEGTRNAITPLWAKSDMGLLRWLHFLATAYIAWMLVGIGGERLSNGFATPRRAGRGVLIAAAIVAVLTIPYAYVDFFGKYVPPVDRFFGWLLGDGVRPVIGTDLFAHPDRIGLLQIAHLIALILLVWAAIGPTRRHWMTHDLVGKVVPVVRKVGTQSLACFMVSIPLSQVDGLLLDRLGREPATWWLVNCFGIGVLIATAYFVGWIKGNPWRRTDRVARPEAGTSGATAEALAGR